MRRSTRSLIRWFAAIAVTTALIAPSTPVAAKAYDPSRIDAVLLREVLAAPTADFDIIVRGAAATRAPAPRATRTGRARAAASLAHASARFALPIVGGVAARAKGAQVVALTLDPYVAYVYRDAVVRARYEPVTEPTTRSTLGVSAIDAPAVWSQLGVTGRGVAVAVVDSGVYPHRDLGARIVAAADFTGATPVYAAGALGDPGGHGTHVAGLIAGDGTASSGKFKGVAPAASIVDVRVIDANGLSTVSTILRGLQWVYSNRQAYGIKVVNMSFGATVTGSYKTDPLTTAAELLTLAGLSVVVAAGNVGPDAGTIATPADDPFVITVGAVDVNGTVDRSDDTIPSWSARGLTRFDGLSKPDVAAPGRRIVSLLSPGSTLALLYPERLVTVEDSVTPEYLRMSGTSMAAPVVAGVVALMLERAPALTPAQVKRRLVSTTTPLGTPVDAGAGMVNALGAVTSTDLTAEMTAGRVTDAVAQDTYASLIGQPIVWLDPTYNGGVDALGTSWTSVTWTNISWDSITWDNISWDSFQWSNISWENISWENISWETTDQLATGALSGRDSGFVGMVE